MVKRAAKYLQLYQKLCVLLYTLFTHQAGYTCRDGHTYVDRSTILITMSWLQLGL